MNPIEPDPQKSVLRESIHCHLPIMLGMVLLLPILSCQSIQSVPNKKSSNVSHLFNSSAEYNKGILDFNNSIKLQHNNCVDINITSITRIIDSEHINIPGVERYLSGGSVKIIKAEKWEVQICGKSYIYLALKAQHIQNGHHFYIYNDWQDLLKSIPSTVTVTATKPI